MTRFQVVIPISEEPDKRSGVNPKEDLKLHPEQGDKVEGVTGEALAVRKIPDCDIVKRDLQVRLKAERFLLIRTCNF